MSSMIASQVIIPMLQHRAHDCRWRHKLLGRPYGVVDPFEVALLPAVDRGARGPASVPEAAKNLPHVLMPRYLVALTVNHHLTPLFPTTPPTLSRVFAVRFSGAAIRARVQMLSVR
jgi:hypothetical protein